MRFLVMVSALAFLMGMDGGKAFSQNWTSYTTDQGLPDNRVNLISFDHNGVLWASTPAGLARYDGTTTKVYTDADGFPFTAINTLKVAPDNQVWVSAARQLFSRGFAEYDGNNWKISKGTQPFAKMDRFVRGKDGSIWASGNGLYRYDHGNWVQVSDQMKTRVQVAQNGDIWTQNYDLVSWCHNGVWKDFQPLGKPEGVSWSIANHSIAVAPDSSIWVSVQHDIARFDGKVWERPRCLDPACFPPNGNISQLAPDPHGGIWAATQDGLGWYDGKKWTAYRGFTDTRTTSVTVAANGDVWAGTLSGASRFDGASWKTYQNEVLPDQVVNDVVAAPDGNMWFATPSGAARFDGSSWKIFRKADGLAGDDVRSLTLGPDNAVWFATGSGITRFDGSVWKSYTTANGLADDRTRKIAFSPEGDLWVATKSGASRLRGSDWTTYTTANGLAGNEVRSLFFDARGIIWFATSEGVSRFDGVTWTTFSVESGLPANDIWSIIQTTDGSLWAATSNGIGIFDGKTWTALTPPPLSSEIGKINKIAFTSDGALWLGTSQGLWKYLNGKWTQYFPYQQDLLEWDFSIIEEDDFHRLWIGTARGLYRMEKEGFSRWGASNGLPDNMITSIAFGPDGSVWLSTPKGIAHLDGGSCETVATPEQLGFTPNAVIVAPDGKVWAALSDDARVSFYEGGVSRFDGEKWTSWTDANGLSSNYISSLAINSKGEVWVGTSSLGVHIFHGSWWGWYTYGTGLPNNDVQYLAFDPSDNLWMAAGSKLYRYDGVAWKDMNSPYWDMSQLRLAFSTNGTPWAGNFSISRYDGSGWFSWGLNNGVKWIRDVLVGPDNLVWAAGDVIYCFKENRWQMHPLRSGLGSFRSTSLALNPQGGLFAGTETLGVMRVDELPAGVNEEKCIPAAFAITGNIPNPFNPSTTLSFTLPRSGNIELSVYSITGQKVRTLLSGRMNAGAHSAVWDGRDDSGKTLSSGIYISHLRSGQLAASRRMTLIK